MTKNKLLLPVLIGVLVVSTAANIVLSFLLLSGPKENLPVILTDKTIDKIYLELNSQRIIFENSAGIRWKEDDLTFRDYPTIQRNGNYIVAERYYGQQQKVIYRIDKDKLSKVDLGITGSIMSFKDEQNYIYYTHNGNNIDIKTYEVKAGQTTEMKPGCQVIVYGGDNLYCMKMFGPSTILTNDQETEVDFGTYDQKNIFSLAGSSFKPELFFVYTVRGSNFSPFKLLQYDIETKTFTEYPTDLQFLHFGLDKDRHVLVSGVNEEKSQVTTFRVTEDGLEIGADLSMIDFGKWGGNYDGFETANIPVYSKGFFSRMENRSLDLAFDPDKHDTMESIIAVLAEGLRINEETFFSQARAKLTEHKDIFDKQIAFIRHVAEEYYTQRQRLLGLEELDFLSEMMEFSKQSFLTKRITPFIQDKIQQGKFDYINWGFDSDYWFTKNFLKFHRLITETERNRFLLFCSLCFSFDEIRQDKDLWPLCFWMSGVGEIPQHDDQLAYCALVNFIEPRLLETKN